MPTATAAPRAPWTNPTTLAQGVLDTFADHGTIPKRCMTCAARLLREDYGDGTEIVNAGRRGELWVCPSCYP
jgi:hypothetical protein